MGAKSTLSLAMCGCMCLLAQPAARRHAARLRHIEPVTQSMEWSPGDINNPALAPERALGTSGSSVVRAQILLDRAHFSCGEIDGYYGSNLAKAVSAYQQTHSLPVTGNLDAPTWAALNQDHAPALVSYQITPEDVAGPFYTIPSDIMGQAKLPALGYSSPLDELGERFHSSPKLLAALNPEIQFDRAGAQIQAPNVNTPPPGMAAAVVVSKSESSVAAVDAQGHVLAWYAATIGSEHDPLPIGEWKITGVRRNPVFHYNPNLFWDASLKDQKAEIKPGPRNPVGLVWIALSKEHYGIHGTPEPGRVGHTESHGCIRLTNWDAQELAGMVKPGTPAILRE